jgi:hypothetical protein
LLGIHESELLFFEVLDDLKDYLDDLVIVGGWLAYLYSKFLWENVSIEPITTVDIDFGLGEKYNKTYPQNIYQILSSLDYEQRHI